MTITLLGTGTGIPSLRRNSPGILIKFDKKTALLDSGPGILKNLLRCGVSYLDLDFIFYTHLHLDHISELATILFAAKIPPKIRKKPLSVYGPNGLKDYYEKIKYLYSYTICTDEYPLNLEEIENNAIEIEGFRISTKTLKHHDGGMGYRIVTPNAKVFVYSGDTDYCSEIVELSKDADLLVLECSSPDEIRMNGHLGPAAVKKITQESNAKKVVLVHMYPVCDEQDLKREFNGKISPGEDLMEFQLK